MTGVEHSKELFTGTKTEKKLYIYILYIIYSILSAILLPPGNFSMWRSILGYTVLKQIICDYSYVQAKYTRINYKLMEANILQILKYSGWTGTILIRNCIHIHASKYDYSLMKANSL